MFEADRPQGKVFGHVLLRSDGAVWRDVPIGSLRMTTSRVVAPTLSLCRPMASCDARDSQARVSQG